MKTKESEYMENSMRKIPLVAFLIVLLGVYASVCAAPLSEVPPKERCPVCGMFVAKYKPWLAQVVMKDGTTKFFDGVKDMMAYYFEPEKYGGSSTPAEVYVTDYYSLKLIDGKKALYVSGSDVLGPMGHELIPFTTQDAAATFKKDHKGKMVMEFEQISLEMINTLRSGSGHKMHMMKKKK